ncbi:MAG: recombination protein RecR [Lentisphaerae bacterium GWF2_52_8]|nr:MAG: recombination protein RecR [Lentisphaerae bacterium GWF2_52_8]
MSSNAYPNALEELIEILKTVPGVGRRSAERMAFSMLKWPPGKLEAFADTLRTLHEKVTPCPECGGLSEEKLPCRICSSTLRDHSLLCIVEEPGLIHNIEKGGLYKGAYHVLGGKLSPLDGKGASELNIGSLLRRIEAKQVREVILALSADVDGQATSIYVANLLKEKGVKITRLAQGLPAGSDISYADSATIAAALSGRISI